MHSRMRFSMFPTWEIGFGCHVIWFEGHWFFFQKCRYHNSLCNSDKQSYLKCNWLSNLHYCACTPPVQCGFDTYKNALITNLVILFPFFWAFEPIDFFKPIVFFVLINIGFTVYIRFFVSRDVQYIMLAYAVYTTYNMQQANKVQVEHNFDVPEYLFWKRIN